MRLSMLRRAAVLTLIAGALGTTACFGSFNMTRKLYGFNKNVSKEKFVRELVFLGLNVVPVYTIAGAIDAIVANSIEFWTGTNPVSMSSTIRLDNTTTVQRYVMEKDGVRILTLKAYKLDQLVTTTTAIYVPGTDRVTFKSTQADGSTETHVAALGEDGKAFVASGTYADLLRSAKAKN